MPDAFMGTYLPSQCIYTETWHDTTVVVSCAGTVDLLTAPELERALGDALCKQPTAVVIDLTKVDFLASRGMSVLIEAHDQLAGRAPLIVVADGPATSRPMKLIGLAELITMRPTLEVALDGLRAGEDDGERRA